MGNDGEEEKSEPPDSGGFKKGLLSGSTPYEQANKLRDGICDEGSIWLRGQALNPNT